MPAVQDAALIDAPNDQGSAIGVLYRLSNTPGENGSLTVQLLVEPWMAEQFQLSDAEQQRLTAERDALSQDIAGWLQERDAQNAVVTTAGETLTLAENTISETKDYAGLAEKRRAFWLEQNKLSRLEIQISKRRDAFTTRVGKLHERELKYRHISALLATAWIDVAALDLAALATKADFPQRFGKKPADPERLYFEFESFDAPLPQDLAEAQAGGYNSLGEALAPAMPIPLWPGKTYNVRLHSQEGPYGKFTTFEPLTIKASTIDVSLANNMVISILLAIIVLWAIQVARRNPNLFIRRIAGLEAVDEAIGRATEMGKPVLYLCGMDPLSELPTISAINILGRVARRIADFDSDLIVPTRDPVVYTVAQEVVKEGYADAGRPDAFRSDNIFFVTDDQFSYTASTCGIMLREKPAANFLMGYYYAESLLLAETGAATGAIQIAGTDSTSQLPFFITTCDYTLIGEELYAASAYLSREPMLLGSLKGLDVAKALLMLALLLQALLFVIASLSGQPMENFSQIRDLFEPLEGA
jgi:hypothetical protein